MVNKMLKNTSNYYRCYKSAIMVISGLIFLTAGGPAFAQDRELQKMQDLADTLFQNMSIDELKMIQQEYQRRIDQITKEEQKMRDMGLEVTQSLLQREDAKIKDSSKS